jgi:hypothetical protein
VYQKGEHLSAFVKSGYRCNLAPILFAATIFR